MGRPIACSSGDGNEAVLLVTNLQTGDTSGVCPDCLPAWLTELATALGYGVVSMGPHAETPEVDEIDAEGQAVADVDTITDSENEYAADAEGQAVTADPDDAREQAEWTEVAAEMAENAEAN